MVDSSGSPPPGRQARWTRLAERRRAAGLSQGDLARLTGVSARTIQRIESRRAANPPLRYLVNCAFVLGCRLEDMIEPEWLTWIDLGVAGPDKPAAPVDYTPAEAAALTALVQSRLPIHMPEMDPQSRGDWSVIAPAMLARMSTAVDALFRLRPEDSWLAAEAIARTVIEMTITFAWLAASPESNVPKWISGSDLERRKADRKHTHWLPEGGYGEDDGGLLSPELRLLVEESAAKMLALGDRAKEADAAWRARIPELRAPGCSLAEIYASAYTHYSMATHALMQPLYRYVGTHPDGGVFVGAEGNDPESTPWAVGLLVFALGLLVSAEALGWPDPAQVRALIVAAR